MRAAAITVGTAGKMECFLAVSIEKSPGDSGTVLNTAAFKKMFHLSQLAIGL
jgi:hypothetical protein